MTKEEKEAQNAADNKLAAKFEQRVQDALLATNKAIEDHADHNRKLITDVAAKVQDLNDYIKEVEKAVISLQETRRDAQKETFDIATEVMDVIKDFRDPSLNGVQRVFKKVLESRESSEVEVAAKKKASKKDAE